MTGYILLAILTLLQAGDAFTTARDIGSKGAYEANPVMAWLFKNLGMIPALILKCFFVFACGSVCLLCGVRGSIALGLMCAGYFWVVWHNWNIK